ncbi:MAG: kinase/pyrophosphorylase [Desulfotalea sp.]
MSIFEKTDGNDFHMIYILSCGEGFNAYHLIQSAIVQFENSENVTVIRLPEIRDFKQIDDVIAKAKNNQSMIAHTLVIEEMREYTKKKCIENDLPSIDLMGDALSGVEKFLGQKPMGKPGLYRDPHSVDLEQVYAIDYALAQDDGLNPARLCEAEVVLVGLSRAGKTPLSMYLAVLGWKAANVPLVIGLPMPEELKQVDRRRIIALNINPEQLSSHRKLRIGSIGKAEIYDYSAKSEIDREIIEARNYYLKSGFTMIDVSNKPIETSAEEIIEIITRRFKSNAHKR